MERETYGQGELLPGDLTNSLHPQSHFLKLITNSLALLPLGGGEGEGIIASICYALAIYQPIYNRIACIISLCLRATQKVGANIIPILYIWKLRLKLFNLTKITRKQRFELRSVISEASILNLLYHITPTREVKRRREKVIKKWQNKLSPKTKVKMAY